MKKTFVYKDVPLVVHESVKAIQPRSVKLLSGFGGKEIGNCLIIGYKGPYHCVVQTDSDLKGKYPVLTGEIDSEGLLTPHWLIASEDKLNADETLEPFI